MAAAAAVGIAAWLMFGSGHEVDPSPGQAGAPERNPGIGAGDRDGPPPDQTAPAAIDPATQVSVILEVTDEQGQPIVAARVQVKGIAGLVAETHTDAAGTSNITLARGLSVAVSARGYVPQTFLPPKFAGADAAWTVTLRPDGDGSRYGALVSPTGAVADGVVAFSDAGTLVAVQRADRAGRFALPALPFDKIAAVSVAHGATEQERKTGVVLELPGGGTITGAVELSDNTPVGGATVRAVPQSVSNMRRVLLGTLPKDKAKRKPLRRALSKMRYAVEARTAAEGEDLGRFVLGPVASGPMSMVAHKNGHIPDERPDMTLASGEEKTGLTFVLQAAPQIRGTVVDADTGEPVVGARIRIEGWGRWKVGDFGESRTGGDGSYTLSIKPDTPVSMVVIARGYRGYREGGLAAEDGETLEKHVLLTKEAQGSKGRTMDYVGVGTVVKKVDKGILVQDLVEGGAASEVLSPGDIILRADGVWLDELSLNEGVQVLLGEEGSEVELLVQKHAAPPDEQEQLVTLERQRLEYRR